MGKIKVCHLTSAHDKEDDRIFLKECVSLADNGYEVYLVECGDSYVKSGVNIVGAGQAPAGRLKRMTSFSKTVFKKAAISIISMILNCFSTDSSLRKQESALSLTAMRMFPHR